MSKKEGWFEVSFVYPNLVHSANHSSAYTTLLQRLMSTAVVKDLGGFSQSLIFLRVVACVFLIADFGIESTDCFVNLSLVSQK